MQDTPTNQEAPAAGNPLSNLKQLARKYKAQIGMGLLLLYVFLLGLGTIGEIWDVQWILDLPLFRPPGKF